MKKYFFMMFVSLYTVLALNAQSIQALRNTIQGTWEIRTNSATEVIYFSSGGIFVLYRNGDFIQDGTYKINQLASNRHSITLDFGIFDRMDDVFRFTVSTNELVLQERLQGPSSGGRTILLSLGTYRRSSFMDSDQNNPLVGTWKGTSEIFRFYRNASTGTVFRNERQGSYFVFQNEPEFTEEWRVRITYNVLPRAGNGEISFYGFNENWQYDVFLVVPFTINGNVLRIEFEDGTREYRRQ